ncbi:MAG: branched-chain amino acid ABC transporter permease [bacterium]
MDVVLQLIINALSLGLTYVLMALGVTMIFSIMGIVNFAHGEIYMIGAFAIYVLITTLHVNFYIALILSVLFVAFLGALLEIILFRKFRGEQLNGLVLAIGVSILLQNLALIIFGGDDHSFPSPFRGDQLLLLGAAISTERILAMTVSVLSLGAIYLFVKHTKTGQAMRAVAQDEEAASLQGINKNYISIMAFAVGCALAGLAGALLAPIYYVSPYIGGMPLLKAFVVVVLGGLGSIPGALVGGLLLGCIDSVCLYALGSLGDIAGFIILILIICIKPSGILSHENN